MINLEIVECDIHIVCNFQIGNIKFTDLLIARGIFPAKLSPTCRVFIQYKVVNT